MRPIEILLLAANLLTLLGLVFPQARALRVVAPVGVIVALVQALLEGWRWQMVPAYALSAIFLLAWVVQRGRSALPTRLGALGAGLGAALGLVALSVSVALPMLVPVFHFPHPTGPCAIGTVTYHWVDSTRGEVYTADPNDRRELMVQVWYPAVNDPGAPRARYVEHSEVLTLLAHLFKMPGFVFTHLKYVRTNAVTSAAAAPGGPWPVLIFSHGRGGYRQHNTMQAEELVSHGYVVAAIDHPYDASGVVFPDGRVAPFDPRMLDPAHPGHNAFHDRILPFLAQDASFTLDRLGAVNQADPGNVLTGKLDLARAGMFGVSLGGATTGEACRMDPRFKACLVTDAFVPADVVRDGLRQPVMWISRDAGTMKLEGWQQRDIDDTQNTMRAVYQSLPGDGYLVLIPGAFHPNFSDFPLFSPLTRWLHLTGPIDANRVFAIMNGFSLAFFDRHLKDQPAPLLDHPAERFPEVLFETHRP